jgi:hypothetical protein
LLIPKRTLTAADRRISDHLVRDRAAFDPVFESFVLARS